jgi:hypothetical protein
MGNKVTKVNFTPEKPSIIMGAEIGKLMIDDNAGEGEVIVDPRFIDCSYEMQVDVVQDWIGLLQRFLEGINDAEAES